MTRKKENPESRAKAIADYVILIGKIGVALLSSPFKYGVKLRRRIKAAGEIIKKYNP